MTQLDVYYDFASPNAYFAHEVLKGVSARTGLSVRNHPVLIGGIFKLTNNMPPLVVHKDCPQKIAYFHVEVKRFIKEHGLTKFRWNSAFPVNTLLPMRVAMSVVDTPSHEDFVDVLMRSVWEDDMDISKPEVLSPILDGLGLDGGALIEAAGTPANKTSLMQRTQACVDRGVFGLPAMFLGDDLYFGKDTLWQIEKAIS